MADPRTDDAPKPADSRKDEKLVKLRPTLFVAIGGTGMEVLMRLRRRTLNALWGSGVRVESLADFPVAIIRRRARIPVIAPRMEPPGRSRPWAPQ